MRPVSVAACVMVVVCALAVPCRASLHWKPTPNVDRCVLSTADPRCLTQCWHEPCCLAVNVSSCEMSYLHTQALHFYKVGAPVMAVEECSCSVRAGGTGGNAFQHPYTRSPITRILATRSSSGGLLTDIGVEYADGTTTDHATWATPQDCSFSPEERITTVLIFMGRSPGGIPIVIGVQFISTVQTCGVLGTSDNAETTHRFSGHRLLFIGGRKAWYVDQIQLTFDYGCQEV